MLLPRVLADDGGEISGKRARHLVTLRKSKTRAADITEAKRPKSAEPRGKRYVRYGLLANNFCSFSLEKQKSPLREFSPV